jgi:hypothetical protein
MNCAGGYVATTLTVVMSDFGNGTIQRLQADCTKLLQGAITDNTQAIGSSSGSIPNPGNFQLACPEDTAAVGIRGEHSSIIERLQLICR